MAATNIAVLKNRHRGKNIFVIGSGASLDFVPKTFFERKITVAINVVYRDWPATYVFAHHHEDAQAAIDDGRTVVTSDYNCGVTRRGNRLTGDYYSYHHPEQPGKGRLGLRTVDLDGDDALVISACTTVSALHFAAHLGASTIWLCGIDGGMVDGALNYAGYNAGGGTKPMHIRWTTKLVVRMANQLRQRGVNVWSLYPFVGMVSPEGHLLELPPRTWQENPVAESWPAWRCCECRVAITRVRCLHHGPIELVTAQGEVLEWKNRA